MANEPALGSVLIAGVKPAKDQNLQWVPVRIAVDDSYSPPRLLIHALGNFNQALPGVYTEIYAYTAGLLTYKGWASPGTATSAAAWAIVKYTYSGTQVTNIQWGGGQATFDQIWDNRATLSYA